MTNETTPIHIGVMVLILNPDGEVLLGKRKNAFAAGEYGIPSGHMESGETFMQAAQREIKEETGLVVSEDNLVLFAISNYLVIEWNRQYVTFDFVTTIPNQKIIPAEPDKCESWEWYNLDTLPQPLHHPAGRTIKQYQQYQDSKKLVIS